MTYRILIGSPIRQDAEVLKEFAVSLKTLDKTNCVIDYFFIDDCDASETCNVLLELSSNNSKVFIEKSSATINDDSYYATQQHNWDNIIINRITTLKNKIIDFASHNNYDFLFLIDSDIILHELTLQRLLLLNKDIVSNIFWTRTSNWGFYEPQVWLMDQRSFFDPSDPLTRNKIYRTAKHMEFIEQLKKQGTYKVGGLGACTLISQRVLLAGVNFKKLYNVSFWGEDRAFCIRAVAAGFDLYVDTCYPAFHIYRKSYLAGVDDFKQNGFNFNKDYENMSISDKFKRKLLRCKIALRIMLYKFFYNS